MTQRGRKYMTPEWREACHSYSMPFDPEILKRSDRRAMQMKAQTTHTGEERWTNLDQDLVECLSSGCSIVGFFVGYSVAQGNKSNDLCQSCSTDAENNIDWNMMPPLCRPDDVDEKNKRVEEQRRTKEKRADASHGQPAFPRRRPTMTSEGAGACLQ